MSPSALRRHGLSINADGVARSAAELLAYPGIDLARLGAIWPELAAIPADIAEQIEIDGRYAGYLERQEQEIEAFRRDEALALPRDLDYARSAACRPKSASSWRPRGRKPWARRRGFRA